MTEMNSAGPDEPPSGGDPEQLTLLETAMARRSAGPVDERAAPGVPTDHEPGSTTTDPTPTTVPGPSVGPPAPADETSSDIATGSADPRDDDPRGPTSPSPLEPVDAAAPWRPPIGGGEPLAGSLPTRPTRADPSPLPPARPTAPTARPTAPPTEPVDRGRTPWSRRAANTEAMASWSAREPGPGAGRGGETPTSPPPGAPGSHVPPANGGGGALFDQDEIRDPTGPLVPAGAMTTEPPSAGPMSTELPSAGPMTTELPSAGPMTTEPPSAGPMTTELPSAGLAAAEPPSARPVATEPTVAESAPTRPDDIGWARQAHPADVAPSAPATAPGGPEPATDPRAIATGAGASPPGPAGLLAAAARPEGDGGAERGRAPTDTRDRSRPGGGLRMLARPRLGELNGRRLDRRAVEVNERRIGKLEPGWGIVHRARSLVVLVVLTLVVAGAITAVLAIGMEAIGVAFNHAISKTPGG